MKKEKLFTVVSIGLIILVTLTTYCTVFDNGFVYDDQIGIVNRDFIKSLSNIPKLFQKENFVRTGEPFYRPVNTIIAMLDYHFWKLNPAGWHVTNLLFHTDNAILIFFIMGLIFKNRRLALLTSLFFAVNPLMTEAVSGIANRCDLIYLFFLLLSFLLFIKNSPPSPCRDEKSPDYTPQDAAKPPNRAAMTWSFVFFIFALFTKEPAIIFPFILILYDITFVIKDKKQILPRVLHQHIYYWIIAALFAVGQLTIFQTPYRAAMAQYPGGSLYYAVLSQFVVMAKYVYLIILPLPLNLNVYQVFPLAKSLFDPRVVFSILLFLTIIITAAASYRKNHLVFFGVFWFYIALLPTSNLIPYAEGIISERYVYVPALGFCLILGFLFTRAIELAGSKNTKAALAALACLIIGLYCWGTMARNAAWQDSYSLWTDAAAKSPRSYKVRHNLGVAFSEAEKFDLALAEFKKSLELKPDYSMTYYNIANIYYRQGNTRDALGYAEKAVELDPYQSSYHINLGAIYAEEKQPEKAVKEFEKAIQLNPKGSLLAYNNLAAMYNRAGKNEEAIIILKKAIAINPNFAPVRLSLALSYLQANRVSEAVLELENVEKIDPYNLEARIMMGRIALQKKDFNRAFAEYSKALECNPNRIQAFVICTTLADMYLKIKSDKISAVIYYRKALDIAPDADAAKQLKKVIDKL